MKAALAQYIANLYLIREYIEKVWPERTALREIIDDELDRCTQELARQIENDPKNVWHR